MTWPQIVVMLVIVHAAVWGVIRPLRMKNESHAMVMFWITLQLALTGGYAWVLHEGGLW